MTFCWNILMNVKQKNLLHQQSPSTFITNKNMESERGILKEVKYGFDILQEYPYSVKRNGCLFPWKEKYTDLRIGMRESKRQCHFCGFDWNCSYYTFFFQSIYLERDSSVCSCGEKCPHQKEQKFLHLQFFKLPILSRKVSRGPGAFTKVSKVLASTCQGVKE